MQTGPMIGKFFISEYFDANPSNVAFWSQAQNGNRSALFDFRLHFTMESICTTMPVSQA
jgi:hypothetical protein